MADDDFATLRFRIDTAQMAQANQYLTQLTQNTQQSADAQNKHASAFDQLNRTMATMLQQQREMNALLQTSIQSQRQGTQSIDDHISSLTKLSAGINAASLAYQVFGRTQQEVAAQGVSTVSDMTRGYQQLATTLDQLATKIQTINQLTRGSGGITGLLAPIAPSSQGAGSAASLAGEVVGSLFPVLQSYLQPQMAAMLQAINQMSARNAIPGDTLLRGMATGEQAGIGGSAGADLVVKMQHALSDMGDAAEYQRRTLQEYGITTKDANQALREFVTQLSQTRDGWAKASAAQQFGIDPGMLTLTMAARLNPIPGGQAELEQRQANRVADLQAANARLQDQVTARQLQTTTSFWGLLPSMNAIRTGGEYTGSDYDAVAQNLRLQRANIPTMTESVGGAAPQLGFWGGQWAELKNMAATVQNNLGSVLPFGLMPPANWAVDRAPDTRGEARIDPKVEQELENFNASIGRFTEQGLQARIAQTQRTGEDILAHTPEAQRAAVQKDIDEALAFFTARLRRAADEIGTFGENMEHQNQILALPPEQRAAATAGLNIAEEMQARGQLPFGQSLPQDQQDRINSFFSDRARGLGKDANRSADEQIAQNRDLEQAYQQGGGAVGALAARFQALQEEEKGIGTEADKASRALKLLGVNISELDKQTAQFVLSQQTRASQSGALVAAGGSPTGQQRAQLIAGVENSLPGGGYNARYQELWNGGQWDEIDKLNKARDDAIAAATTTQQNEQAAAAARAHSISQTQQSIIGGGAMAISPTPGKNPDLTTGNEATISDLLAHGALTLPNGYTVTGNEGYTPNGPGSPHVANSDHGYASAMDVRITGPNGQIIPNRGGDPTGMYGQLFAGATAYQQQAYPQFNGEFYWGNGMLTRGTSGEADIMHYGLRGPGVGNGGGVPAAALAVPGSAGWLAAQARAQAYGANPTGTQQEQATAAADSLARSLTEATHANDQANTAQAAILQLEQQRPAAILAGGDAQARLDDQIKILTESIKNANSPLSLNADALKKVNEALAAQVTQERAITEAGQRATIARQFEDQQAATQRATGALVNGGMSAMQLQQSSEAMRAQLIATGMNPDQAQQIATASAAQAKSAQDYQTAIVDASNEISQGMKQGIGDIVDGLTKGIGQAHGFRYAMEDVGKQISQIGLNMFVKQPLSTLTDNLAAGRGFNFNVGTSGLSTTEALGKAFSSGLGATMGVGGGATGLGNRTGSAPSNTSVAGDLNGVGGTAGGLVNSSGNADTNWLSDIFGGKNSVLGRAAAGWLPTRQADQDQQYLQWAGNDPTVAGWMQHHTGGRIYHDGSEDGIGGLAGDEVPAILQTGETVLSRTQTAAFDKMFPGGPGDLTQNFAGLSPARVTPMEGVNSGAGPVGELIMAGGGGGLVGLVRGAFAAGAGAGVEAAVSGRAAAMGVMPSAAGLPTMATAGQVNALYNTARYGAGVMAGSVALYGKYHGGGRVYRYGLPVFDDGGSVTGDLNAMLQQDNSAAAQQGNWATGPGIGGGGTQSGVGPGTTKATQSPGNAMFASLFAKADSSGLGFVNDVMKNGLPSWLGGGNSPDYAAWGSKWNGGNLWNPAGTQLASAGGDYSAGAGDDYSGSGYVQFHTGGVVRRYHSGGLASNELPPTYARVPGPTPSPPPAIATGAGGGNPVTIHQNIYTPDANSFRANADMVAGASYSAQMRAQRNS